jgi:TonB family protein
MRKILAPLVQTALLAGGLALATSPLYASETPAGSKIPAVKPHLELTKAYPSEEVMELSDHSATALGRAVVSFHVREDGRFENIKLVQTSGAIALDEQTVKSVQQASCSECAGHDYTVGYTYKLD